MCHLLITTYGGRCYSLFIITSEPALIYEIALSYKKDLLKDFDSVGQGEISFSL